MDAVHSAYLFEQAMITRHIPFEIIFDQHLGDLSRYRAVVLPDVRMMDDRAIERVLRYVDGGGCLILTDQTATMDDWLRPRGRPLSRFFSQEPPADKPLVERRGKGKIAYTRIRGPVPFVSGAIPLNADELAATVASVMGPPSIRTDAPPCVAVECVRQPGRVLLNLVDFSESKSGPPIRIDLAGSLGKVKRARLLSPRDPEVALAFQESPGGTTIAVPGISRYAVVVAARYEAGMDHHAR